MNPSQPDLAQYPISELDLFPSYATRAAYLAATGKQAPPFNPALPLKAWFDSVALGADGPAAYIVFDSTSAATGYEVAMGVPASSAGVNLVGTYNFPAYVEVPTDATETGPFGPVGLVEPNTVCLLADAQALAVAIAPLYPGKTVSVLDNSAKGIYRIVYGNDPRRQYGITVSGGGPSWQFAQSLIESKYVIGVGSPGHWAIAQEGMTAFAGLTWMADPQVTTAPAGALSVPVPIRALLPNEQFQLVPPSNPLFSVATWMVVRTDMQLAVTLVQIQQLVAQYNAQAGVTPVTLG
jgi:hypothetical protein